MNTNQLKLVKSEGSKKEPKEKELRQKILDVVCIDPNHDDIGYICRSMVLASMPHKKFQGTIFEKRSGNYILKIEGGTSEADSIPFGVYPRLIIAWIVKEAVRTKSKKIVLGNSLSDFMKKLEINVYGGKNSSFKRFKDQLTKLLNATITVKHIDDKTNSKGLDIKLSEDNKVYLFWETAKPNQNYLFDSYFELSDVLFQEIMSHPIPVDNRAIKILKSSSMAMDIYFWLTYRFSYLSKDTFISFDNLRMQFATNHTKNDKHAKYNFKRDFIKYIQEIKKIYPKANFYIDEKRNGILLKPSETHVPKVMKEPKRMTYGQMWYKCNASTAK